MSLLRWMLFAAGCVMMTSSAPDLLDRVRRAPRVKRVIGGRDVTEGAWPWLAQLTGKIPSGSWWSRSNKYYYCGGSIVNKNWILTAAHCFHAKNAPAKIMTPKHWHIKAGEVDRTHNIFDNIGDWICRLFNLDSCKLWYVHAQFIFIHPDYRDNDGANWKNDIALVKISKDLPVGVSNPNIASTTLPISGDISWPAPGTDCIMKGWGCTTNGGPQAETAKQVPLPAQASSVCDRLFGDISNTRVCAGVTLKNKGICAGDSGGPLVCKKGTTWVQAGLASFTSARNPQDVPGVFTRIAYYRDWIDRTIRNN